MSREQVETTYGLMREQGILDASDFLSDHKWVSLGQRLLNGAFEAMSLAGWVTGGGGTVSLVSAGTSSAGSWAKLTTGSPVTISQAVTTPQDPFELTFSYELTTASGTLDVLLDSVVLATIAVPDPPPVGPETFTKLIADPQLLGREDAVLTFRFNGPAGSEVLVSNIEMESSVPPSPPLVPADFDRDGDVDLTDFSHLQACLNGSESPQTDPNCQDAKLNADDKVDRADVDIFLGCLSGSGVPADPNCAGQ